MCREDGQFYFELVRRRGESSLEDLSLSHIEYLKQRNFRIQLAHSLGRLWCHVPARSHISTASFTTPSDGQQMVSASVMGQATSQLVSCRKVLLLSPSATLCSLCDLILIDCVSLDKSFNLSVPQVSQLQNGEDNSNTL